MTYGSAPANQNTGMATPSTSMSEWLTSSRTTMPTKATPSTRQSTSVKHQDSSHNGHPQCCMHVHQPVSQVHKPGESLALRKVKHLLSSQARLQAGKTCTKETRDTRRGKRTY